MFKKALFYTIKTLFLTVFAYSYLYAGGIKTYSEINLLKLKESSSPQRIYFIDINAIGKGQGELRAGLLFTYKNRMAKTVTISGNFSSWKLKHMNRNKNGIWYFFLPAKSDLTEVTYKYNVDGQWTADSKNFNNMDDNMGGYLSISKNLPYENKKSVSYKILPNHIVEFRIFSPRATLVSIVGDFNNWNPENDLLKANNNGVWVIRKKLLPGKYRYNFIIDGKWNLDLYNSLSESNPSGATCSVIKIKGR